MRGKETWTTKKLLNTHYVCIVTAVNALTTGVMVTRNWVQPPVTHPHIKTLCWLSTLQYNLALAKRQ